MIIFSWKFLIIFGYSFVRRNSHVPWAAGGGRWQDDVKTLKNSTEKCDVLNLMCWPQERRGRQINLQYNDLKLNKLFFLQE